jgi:hypothetical protein
MKARINKTGEIVNLASYATITLDVCDSWGNPIETKPEEIELIQDKTNDFDWQSFRAEAAKDFVSIMCNHRYDTKEERYPVICKEAIALAYELIKQLKEKAEK